jgi:hypothetical protein
MISITAVFQIITFAIVTHAYNVSWYPTFNNARPGFAYVLSIFTWVIGLFTAVGVVATGISADRGHHWAAGNRAYRRIDN